MPRKKAVNPFYVLLLAVGVAFTITAAAYGVMAYHETRPGGAWSTTGEAHLLLSFMSQHGDGLMIGELALLGIFTVGAIGTDHLWNARASATRTESTPRPSPPENES